MNVNLACPPRRHLCDCKVLADKKRRVVHEKMAEAIRSTTLLLLLPARQVGGFFSKNLGSPSQGLRVPFNPNLASRREHIVRGEPLVVTSVLGKKATTKRETVIPEPDYRLPVVLLGFAGGLAYTNNLLPAAPVGLLGLLLLFQTTRVRFVFDDEALEVKIGEQLQESGENVFVGGKNRWKYSTFVNWELWWPGFSILVYFKETQTRPEGQVHFFPVIFNGKQLYDVMIERAGPSKTSGPKP